MTVILSSALLALSLQVGVSSASAREQALRDQWRGRTVTLKEPLFTVEYRAASAVLPGQAATVTQGIVVVAGDGAIRYAARPGGSEIVETTPQRLVDRIKAERPVTLLRYDAGTEMNIGEVGVDGRWVVLALNDWFHTGGPPTTTLRLEWPAGVTRDAPSPGDLEAALSRVAAWSGANPAAAQLPPAKAADRIDRTSPLPPDPSFPASAEARGVVPFTIGHLAPLRGRAGPMCLTGVTFDTLEEEPSRVGRLVRRDSELHTTLRAQFTIEPGCPGAEPAFGRWKFAFTVTLLDANGAVMATIDKELGDGDVAGKVLRFSTRVHRAVVAASRTADISVVARRPDPRRLGL